MSASGHLWGYVTSGVGCHVSADEVCHRALFHESENPRGGACMVCLLHENPAPPKSTGVGMVSIGCQMVSAQLQMASPSL